MTRILVIRSVLLAICWLTLAAGLGVVTARYTEARHPHDAPVCCAAGTTGHSDGATP